MRNFILALFLAGCLGVLAETRSPQRIVGGTVTDIANWPYTAAMLARSLFVSTFSQSCGGIVLTSTAILTCAHCFRNDVLNTWRVRVGSTYSNSGGVVHEFRSYTIHPNYNSATQDSDIAVFRTATAIVYGLNVQPASIAGPNYNVADDQPVWAVGWGATAIGASFSEELRQVQVLTVNQQLCQNLYGSSPITDNMLCSGWVGVGGRDQCTGDSGGPLLHNNVVVGVCSWGLMCALPQHPGVNVRVSRFTSWIQAAAAAA